MKATTACGDVPISPRADSTAEVCGPHGMRVRLTASLADETQLIQICEVCSVLTSIPASFLRTAG